MGHPAENVVSKYLSVPYSLSNLCQEKCSSRYFIISVCPSTNPTNMIRLWNHLWGLFEICSGSQVPICFFKEQRRMKFKKCQQIILRDFLKVFGNWWNHGRNWILTHRSLLMPYAVITLSCYVAIHHFNSLAPGRFQFNFRKIIFKLTLVYGGWGISYEIALRWMPLDLTDVKSTLVQVMAWCRQATSHYLSQCWPRSMSPKGVNEF